MPSIAAHNCAHSTGLISPYPTEVIVMTEKYKEFQNELSMLSAKGCLPNAKTIANKIINPKYQAMIIAGFIIPPNIL